MAYDARPEPEPIKAFLSYSRADTTFALELVNALQACGFEAFIDQEDIAPGEPWEERLGGLIESADTIVYILSPDSLTSENCSWEVAETLRLNKRLLPVVWRPVPDDQVPKELSQLNYVFFDEGKSFAIGLKELSAALRVDHEWIREHTRLGALARRWDGRGRTDALLLRGEELEAASTWMARRPHGAPAVSDDQMDFISNSKAAADAADRAARNRRRGLLVAVSVVALAMAGLAGVSVMQWQEAEKAKDFAVEAYDLLTETNDELQGAYIRLSSDIALRAPSTGNAPFETKGGWFPVAANFAGGVVRLQRGRQTITGLLIDGAVIHPDWTGTPYVLIPRFVSDEELIAEDQRLNAFLEATDDIGAAGAEAFEGERFSRAFVRRPEDDPTAIPDPEPFDMPPSGNLDDEQIDHSIMEQRFLSPEDLAVEAPAEPSEANLDDPEIDHSIMEQRFLTPEELAPEGLAAISATFPTLKESATIMLASQPVWQRAAHLEAEPMFKVFALQSDIPFGARAFQPSDFDCERDPWGPSGGGRFALFGIDGLTAVSGGTEELTLLITSGLDVAGSEGVTYRHATLKGAFGAPVFDLETGKIIAIHQGVDANRLSSDGRVGFAEPIMPLLEMIQQDVAIENDDLERTAPFCFRD
ncbi:MAG: toll/interleukin-1 receptor domain-containing protein [Pseudomonadota bacterium]